MLRIVRLLALAMGGFSLVVLSVLVIAFWPVITEWVVPPRSAALPPLPALPPTVQTPAPTFVAPPPPPRKGRRTWAEVEAVITAIQAKRGHDPDWADDLFATYQMIADPAFTDSADLVDHLAELAQWRKEAPDSPTPLVAMARAKVGWAWEARGPWLAARVSEEDQLKFRSRIADARQLLEEAMEMGVKDGEACRLMLAVAMAEGWPNEQARAMLDEGRQIDPTYFPMYVQFARYLLPRWHGKRGDIERFAADIAESLPGDDGLEAFARIALAIHQTDVERELVFLGSYDRSLLVQASEVLRQRHESTAETHFAALCAWVAQDRQAAKRLQPLIGDPPENDRIWPWRQHHAEFKLWCRYDDFSETGETRWFWGSAFDDKNLIFSADSQSVWCGGGYGRTAVNRLDITQGQIVQSLPGPEARVECLAVDDRQGLAVAGIHDQFFSGLLYWDLRNPQRQVVLANQDRCRLIALSPAEPKIAWFGERGVHLIDLETRTRGASFSPRMHTSQLRFSADGKSLIATGERHSIWDVATGTLVREMPHAQMRPAPDVLCRKILDIDADGCIWALVEKRRPAPTQGLLVRYDADGESWTPIISNLGYPLSIPENAVLSADHRLLALNHIYPVKQVPHIGIDVWDVESGQMLKRFSGHYSGLFSICFSPDGKWLASMGFPTGLVRLWAIDDQSEP